MRNLILPYLCCSFALTKLSWFLEKLQMFFNLAEKKDVMQNDPELSGKYLGTITADFAVVSDTLKEAAYQIRKRGYSEYPIFPIAKTDIPVGQLLIGQKELAVKWNYYASFLDEFVQRKLVDEDKVEEFKKTYKNPDEFCCLFVVDVDFTNFLYIPYPED